MNCLAKSRLLTVAVAAVALWAAACGGGHPAITPPPPTGKFTNASLNGTYAFVTNGEAFTSGGTSPTPVARTGSFTADGAGGIKAGGVYDLVNSGGSGTTASAPNPITGGGYTVSQDGRGTLTLNINSGGTTGSINFGFVLTSGSSGPPSIASGGLMIDETSNSSQASTGSGSFVLQNPAAFGISNVAGSYVFDFSGSDASGSPESLVGEFSANSGAISGGLEDSNDGGALNSGAIAPGAFVADPTNMSTAGRGTATIAGQTYAFYIVDSTRIRFVSINSSGVGPMLTGDAVAQPSVPPSPSGSYAFLVAGATANGGLIRVGRFTVSGSTVSKILMDVNNGGSSNEFSTFMSPTINYDATTGRGVVSFSASTLNVYSFVFYLSSANTGVIQDVSPSDSTTPASQTADGTIALQSGSSFTSSNITGPYAMNWSGLVTSNGTQDEEDLLAQATVTNLSLSGTSDLFQFTSSTLTPQLDLGISGSINFNNGDGTGDDGKAPSMPVRFSGASQINMVVYIVNPQLAFFVSGNNNPQRIVAGILQAQQ